MSRTVRKAVFPVAGMGTRFLPATKANPKEMLSVVDKPLIQYAVEEAVEAGCTQLIFVTSSSKRAIEDHFDKNFELEDRLEKSNKRELLAMVRDILPVGVTCAYVRQPEALGLGHAVLCAREVVGNEPFAVILADDLIDGVGSSCLSQMAKVYKHYNCSVLGVETIDPDMTEKYGIIKGTTIGDRLSKVEKIVEKPKPDVAPSNQGVVGRYILSPLIFDMLEKTKQGAIGEIQLTDAIEALLSEQQVLGYQFDGRRYDCGSKLGFLQATVEYGLKHEDLRDEFQKYLKSFCI